MSVSLVRERIVLHASSEEETASARMKDALPLHSEARPSPDDGADESGGGGAAGLFDPFAKPGPSPRKSSPNRGHILEP